MSWVKQVAHIFHSDDKDYNLTDCNEEERYVRTYANHIIDTDRDHKQQHQNYGQHWEVLHTINLDMLNKQESCETREKTSSTEASERS